MPSYLPALVAVAAVALTYLFCIRPVRRGGACLHRPSTASRPHATSRELELARTELELLRLRHGRHEHSGPAG